MDENRIEINQDQQNIQLRNEFDELQSKELRSDVRLVENEQLQMSAERVDYHTVENARAENLRIGDMLSHAEEINLREADQNDLRFRIRQNKNFEMVNNEKFGGDSKIMKPVKESIRSVDVMLRGKVGKAYDRKQLIHQAIREVNTAIDNCDRYLRRGKSIFFWRWKRYDMVSETKERFEDDLDKLRQALDQDDMDDVLIGTDDTLMDLMNRAKIRSRQSDGNEGENEVVSSAIKKNLYGVGSYDYDLSVINKNIETQSELVNAQKVKLDRTTCRMTFLLAENKGLTGTENAEAQYRIYEDLSVNADDESATVEQRQKKVETLESFFKILMDHDVTDFDFKTYREALTSEKFRKNYLISKVGWDADKLFTEYKRLLADPKGLQLKYNADEFAEIEAKRNMMGTISALYDALEIYYTNKELWRETPDQLLALSFEEVTARMEAAVENSQLKIVDFYSAIMTMKERGTEYNIHVPANDILQANRRETVNRFVLLSEEFKEDELFTDIQKENLKIRLISEIKGDKVFDEIDPDTLPYECLKSIVRMLAKERPSDSEYVKTVTDHIKEMMDSEDMGLLARRIKRMNISRQGSELRDLCVYALSYGSKAPELKRESFEDFDTETLRTIINDKVTIAKFKINEYTKDDKKQEIANACREILIEHFKANEDDVRMLSPEKCLSCAQRALNKFPDMSGIGDIIGGRFEILNDSFNGMMDMKAADLSQLKEKAIAEIKKGHEFAGITLEGLPIPAIKEIVQKLNENNPSPEAFEDEVKKYINEYFTSNSLDIAVEKVRDLNAKEEKTDRDNLDLREYALYYLLNQDLSTEKYEKFQKLDTDLLKSVASDKAAAMKLPDDGFGDIDQYNEAKALCIKCLTAYAGLKAEDIELLPADKLVALTKKAFIQYPDTSEIPAEIATQKAALLREALETEKKDADNGMFAESLYASLQKKGDVQDEKKAALDSALAREGHITSILAHTNKYGAEADTKHLSDEQVAQIAIGTDLSVNLPADKLDRSVYKETFDEYTNELAVVIAKAFSIEESQIGNIAALGFDELFKLAGQMKDWLLDAKGYETAKEQLLDRMGKAKLEGNKERTKKTDSFEEEKELYDFFKRPIERVEKPKFKKEWSDDERKTLSLIGELTFTTNVTDHNGLAYSADERVRKILLENAETLAKLMVENKGEMDTMTTLQNGLKKSEQILVGSVGEVLKSIIAKMKEQKGDIKWDAAAVKKCLDDEAMSKFLTEKDKDIENAVLEGSKELQANLDLVTESALESAEDTIGNLIYDEAYVPKQATDKEKLDEIRDSIYKKNTANGKFMQKLLKDYYRYSTPEEQRFMMSYIIKDLSPVQSSREYDMTRFSRYFTSMVKGAGPVMQKLMQGLPDRVVSPGVAAAVQASKSDLRPISDKYVDQVLERMKNESKGEVQTIKKIRSLGAASIAETFLCEIKDKKGYTKEIVVKIKRPDAKMHIENESKFLVKLANDADETGVMGKSVANHINKIYEELDFSNEVKNALIGQAVYNETDSKTKGTVSSVKINKSIPIGEDYIVMDKAEGVTLDRYIVDLKKRFESILDPIKVELNSGKKKAMLTSANIAKINEVKEKLYKELMLAQKQKDHVYELAHKWCYEAYFNKYFHHGDLHSGNIMVSDKSATVLDYGNASKFSGNEITPITKMTAAAGAKNTEIYVNAMVDLLKQEGINVSDAQKEMLKKKFCPIMALGTDKDAGKRIIVSILIAQENGIPVPRAIQNFAICEQRLENSIDEMNAVISEMKNQYLDLNGIAITADIKNDDNPLVEYIRKYRKNLMAKRECQKTDDQICDEVKEEYGLVDEQYYDEKLKSDNKDNDYANNILDVHQKAEEIYDKNKSVFEKIKKNKDRWIKETAVLRKLMEDPNTDQKELGVRRDKLMKEISIVYGKGPTALYELYGYRDMVVMYQNAFVYLDPAAVKEFMDIFTDELDLSLAAAKTGEKYISNKGAFFITQKTIDASRKVFAGVCQQYNSYKNSVSGPAVKQIESVDPDSQDNLVVSKMYNTLQILYADIVAKDKNGNYIYDQPAQRIDRVYKELKGLTLPEIEKKIRTDVQIQNDIRYFKYILDENRYSANKSFTVASMINSAEGKAFKKTYEDYRDVCERYAIEKFFGNGVPDELKKEFKSVKAKFAKDYDTLIRSEIEKHRKYANADTGTPIEDLADILTEEIQKHSGRLITRVGLFFQDELKPDTPEYKAKYGVV